MQPWKTALLLPQDETPQQLQLEIELGTIRGTSCGAYTQGVHSCPCAPYSTGLWPEGGIKMSSEGNCPKSSISLGVSLLPGLVGNDWVIG